MRFDELQLHPDLLRGITDAGLIVLTQVQEETLPHTLAGKDVFVQSQTGTGKTAAFLVALYQLMLTDRSERRDSALVIAPTRELAGQIEDEAKLLGVHLPFSVGSVYGGVSYIQQERLLRQGLDIVVGTPGRLIDLGQKGRFDFRDFGYLVIDEADRLFDMGFYPDLRRMLRKMRPNASRQTMLYSATLSFKVRLLASEHMNEPAEVAIAPEQVTVDTVNQELYHVGRNEKMSLLLGIFERDKPTNGLLFVNMKHMAEEVSARLVYNGYDCDYLTGDLPQARRQRIMDRFKSGDLKFLVATDVAARGLHVDDLEIVVNYDLPEFAENYVHRIGRTARAGKSGKAITLACEQFVESLPAVEKFIGGKIPVAFADGTLYVDDRSVGVIFGQRRRSGGGGRPRDGRRGGSRDSRGGGRDSRGGGRDSRGGGRGTSRPCGSRSSSSGGRRHDSERVRGSGQGSGHGGEGRVRYEQRPPSQPARQHETDHKHKHSRSRARRRQEPGTAPAQGTPVPAAAPGTHAHGAPRKTLFRKIAGIFRKR